MLKTKSKKSVAKKTVKAVKAKAVKKPAAKKLAVKKPAVAKKIVVKKAQPIAKPAKVVSKVASPKVSVPVKSIIIETEETVTTPAYSSLFQSVAVEESPIKEKKILMPVMESFAWKKVVMVVGVSVMTLMIGAFWIQITKGYFESIDASPSVGLTDQIKTRVSQDLNALSPEANQIKDTVIEGAQKLQDSQVKKEAAPLDPATVQLQPEIVPLEPVK